MLAAPPLQSHPTHLLDPSAVQHVDVTEHAHHVPGQTQGYVLLQTDRLRQMLMAVPAGLTMPWHRATCDVTVTVVVGTGALTLGDAEAIRLRPGVHLFLPEGAPHAVEAESDLTLIATFADPESEIQFIERTAAA